MADTFMGLGLRPELAEAAAAAGYARPSAIQRGAIPVLRRGGNVVLHATAGSGVVGAYGLALLDRLAGTEPEPGAGPRALVVVPAPENASRVALSLARFARVVGLRAASAGAGWPEDEREPDLLVLGIADALRRVRASLLKLDRLAALVLDGAGTTAELFGWDTIEAVFVTVPRESQRVITAEALTSQLDDFVERHARRALYVPARTVPGAAAGGARGEPSAVVDYVLVTGAEKQDAAAALVAGAPAGAGIRFHCRTAAVAERLASDLALRGFQTGVEGATVVAGAGTAAGGGAEQAVSCGVPLDAEMLLERHGGGGAVLVEPRELGHLRRIAGEARFKLQPRTLPAPEVDGEIARFRELLLRAAREEDLAAQLLLIEPLLAEFAPLEIAAAASGLLRRSAAAAAPAPVLEAPPAAGPPPPAWVRLFISIGERDNVRPGDLVGAITGEAGVPGSAVGRIEIRDTFSIAEVTRETAERVLKALNGITLKGRSVRADYDRKGAAPSRRRPGGGPRE